MASKTVENAEQLKKHVDKFIEKCQREDVEPSDYELCQYIGISQPTLDRYRGGKGAYEGYDEPLKTLISYREHRLVERLNDPGCKNTAGIIFQLKQPKNGGYQDVTQQMDGSATITLKIDGVGGVDAFR